MQPIYKIELDGQDITDKFNDRLISMAVVQHAGNEADTLDIELDDRGSQLTIPPKGKSLEVFMGYVDTGVTSLGIYTVDNIVLDWSPARKMTIKGKSADLKKPELKEHRTNNYENKTLGDVAKEVAGRANLQVVLSDEIAALKLGAMLHQNDESDMGLLTRLARDNNGLFKVGGGKLILSKRGAAMSASGDSMDVTVTPRMVSIAKVTLPDRSEFGTTTAYHHDFDTGKRTAVDGGGGGAGAFVLKHNLPDADTAKQAATARKEELDRGKADAHVELSLGNPAITASGDLTLKDFREGMDGTYTITSVDHNFDSSGYTTKIDGEMGGTDKGGAPGFGPDVTPKVATAPAQTAGNDLNPNTPDDNVPFDEVAPQPAAPYVAPTTADPPAPVLTPFAAPAPLQF